MYFSFNLYKVLITSAVWLGQGPCLTHLCIFTVPGTLMMPSKLVVNDTTGHTEASQMEAGVKPKAFKWGLLLDIRCSGKH